MMKLIPRWRVTIRFDNGAREPTVFFISDEHASNVLRHVASMQFSENGLERETRIVVELVNGS